jgi:hypothetical protein
MRIHRLMWVVLLLSGMALPAAEAQGPGATTFLPNSGPTIQAVQYGQPLAYRHRRHRHHRHHRRHVRMTPYGYRVR